MPPQTRRIYQHPSLPNPSAQLQGAFMEWEVPLPGPVQAYKNYRGTPEELASYLRNQGLLGDGLRSYLYRPVPATGVVPVEVSLSLTDLHTYLRFDSYADTVVYLPALTAADLPASVLISHTSVSGTNTVTVKGSNPFGGLETFAVLSSGEAVALAGANLNGTIGWVKTGAVGGPTAADLQVVATTLPLATTRTADYTLQLTDAGKLVPVASSSAVTVTVPAHADVAFPVGTTLYVAQDGAGQLTLAAASGVVVNTADGYKVPSQWADVALHKRDLNTWVLKGGAS